MGMDEARASNGTFWAMLSPANQAAIRQAGTVRRFNAADIICRQGDQLRHVVVLLSGRVGIETQGRFGQSSALIALRNAGDIIGEMAAVDGSPRSATVRALADLTALMVPEQRFVALCRQNPELTWTVLRVVVQRMRETNEYHADAVGASMTIKIANALDYLATQQSISRPGAAGGQPEVRGRLAPNSAGRPARIAVTCTQQQLAALAGASRESVVRAMKLLKHRGIIVTGRGRIVILRPDLLRDFSG